MAQGSTHHRKGIKMVKIAITMEGGFVSQVFVSEEAEVAVIEMDKDIVDRGEVYSIPAHPGETFLGEGRMCETPEEVVTGDSASELVRQVQANDQASSKRR